jgi:hypothetical protein
LGRLYINGCSVAASQTLRADSSRIGSIPECFLSMKYSCFQHLARWSTLLVHYDSYRSDSSSPVLTLAMFLEFHSTLCGFLST